MSRTYLLIISRFILLVALQVLIIDHINLGGYINPPLYVLFILLLPFDVSGSFLLISSFLLGMTIDIFSNSTGLHAGSSVLMAFMRPYMIKLVGSPAEYEDHFKPGIEDMGVRWFVAYAGVMILWHQLAFSLLESFYLSEIGNIVLRMLLTTLVTVLVILVVDYLFLTRRK